MAMPANIVDLSAAIATSLHRSVGYVTVLTVDPLQADAVPGVDQRFVFVVLVLTPSVRYVDASVTWVDLADDQATGVMNASNKEGFSIVRIPAAIHGVLWDLTISGWTPL